MISAVRFLILLVLASAKSKTQLEAEVLVLRHDAPELSRGMNKTGEQLNTDELHLRTFWRRWNAMMTA